MDKLENMSFDEQILLLRDFLKDDTNYLDQSHEHLIKLFKSIVLKSGWIKEEELMGLMKDYEALLK